VEDFEKVKECREFPHSFAVKHAQDFYTTKENQNLYCKLSPCPNRYSNTGDIVAHVSEAPNEENEVQAQQRYTPQYICKKEDLHLS
jgi:hypothetical protein